MPSPTDAAALADAGDWQAALAAYSALLTREESGDVHRGLARACWWLGDTHAALEHAELAFAAYEEESRNADAAMVGVYLCIWYLTNFDNLAAAAREGPSSGAELWRWCGPWLGHAGVGICRRRSR